MVIDLESFQQITIGAGGVAQIGGGFRLGDMALGIDGHASYGGFGLDSRMWGITLDTIVGLDVVLANGSFIHAISTAYPNIYYALRGAADSFGIITTFYLQTLAAPAFVVNWQWMFVCAATTTAVFTHIQAFARNASVVDRKLGLGVYLAGSDFSLSGTYIGNLTTFNTEVAPELLRGLPYPLVFINQICRLDRIPNPAGLATATSTAHFPDKLPLARRLLRQVARRTGFSPSHRRSADQLLHLHHSERRQR
ncbi:MAG: hypothetical protein ASARMPRED_005752 [Alectoria sarmentosa]|nr:MAG: hypothetical protein ASARMPRED_005752 [Alectoria sarmentosa]